MADLKTQDGKIRVELVPYELIEQAGCALTYGVAKHGRERSYEDADPETAWPMYAGAALRHLGKYMRSRLAGGNGRDPESGLSHLAGASASIAILMRMEAKRDNLPTGWSLLGATAPIPDRIQPCGDDLDAAMVDEQERATPWRVAPDGAAARHTTDVGAPHETGPWSPSQQTPEALP